MRTSTLTLLWCLLLAALGGGVHARTEIVARAAIVYNDGKDGGGGEAGGESWAEATDPQTSTLALEEAQVNAAAGGGGATTTTRLEREYVWGPGDKGLDELLVQYDAATASGGGRTPWWCLQDAGGDVVMLARAGGANGTATCAAQWTYDAYGAVIAENVFNAGAPVSRAGHKGLFADRLDGAVVTTDGGPDTKRLAVGGKLLYYNRNRTFSPELGRFLQSDPNATALALIGATRHHGRGFSALAGTLDLEQLYGDGASLYSYMRSDPWSGADPLGLSVRDTWWEDTQDGAGLLWQGFQTFMSFTDAGGLVGSMLEALLENYAANLEADIDWALDWSQGDDWHSRRDDQWVTEAMVTGAYRHFGMDYWLGSEPEHSGPGVASVASTLGRTAPELAAVLKRLRAGMVFSTHHQAKAVKALKGLGSAWDAHHLLPVSWANALQLDENGPAVLLRKEMHQKYTTRLNQLTQELKKQPGQARKHFARARLQELYRNEPEWWEAIEPMLR